MNKRASRWGSSGPSKGVKAWGGSSLGWPLSLLWCRSLSRSAVDLDLAIAGGPFFLEQLGHSLGQVADKHAANDFADKSSQFPPLAALTRIRPGFVNPGQLFLQRAGDLGVRGLRS